MTPTLAASIEECRHTISQWMVLGKARWDRLVAGVAVQERSALPDFYAEEIWTFLVSCGYAAAGEEGVARLGSLLTQGRTTHRPNHRIWFEVLPMSPRFREKNTNVDLAVGDLRLRAGMSGIELDPVSESWTCFVEAKWYSDIDTKVTHHVERNQLARVAENAACLQAAGVLVTTPYVTLLTPRRFRDSPIRSRLYAYKYREYSLDRKALAAEWDYVNVDLPVRRTATWNYPERQLDRAAQVHFAWIDYETLLTEENLPRSDIKYNLLRTSVWNANFPSPPPSTANQDT